MLWAWGGDRIWLRHGLGTTLDVGNDRAATAPDEILPDNWNRTEVDNPNALVQFHRLLTSRLELLQSERPEIGPYGVNRNGPVTVVGDDCAWWILHEAVMKHAKWRHKWESGDPTMNKVQCREKGSSPFFVPPKVLASGWSSDREADPDQLLEATLRGAWAGQHSDRQREPLKDRIVTVSLVEVDILIKANIVLGRTLEELSNCSLADFRTWCSAFIPTIFRTQQISYDWLGEQPPDISPTCWRISPGHSVIVQKGGIGHRACQCANRRYPGLAQPITSNLPKAGAGGPRAGKAAGKDAGKGAGKDPGKGKGKGRGDGKGRGNGGKGKHKG